MGMPSSIPQHSRPSGAFGHLGHGPEPKGTRQSSYTGVPSASSQDPKHHPKGLSRARLCNPSTHSPGSTSATSTPAQPHGRGHSTLLATLCLQASQPAHTIPSIPAQQPPNEPQIHPQLGPGMLQRGMSSYIFLTDGALLGSFCLDVYCPPMKHQ